MLKPEQTPTTRQKYVQLQSTGFKFRLLAPDDPDSTSPAVVRRHKIICHKTKTHWPLENLKRGVESGLIRLGLFSKSDKIIGIGYYSEITDICTLERGIFVYGLQLDASASALEFAELTFSELADEFNYSFVRFASPRKGWGGLTRHDWSLKYSVWEHQYERR